MRVDDIIQLVEGTADAAFATDRDGQIVAWNSAAREMFGIKAREAKGKSCSQIVQGMDECGPVCSQNCTVHQSVQHRHPVRNFDLRVQTAEGKRWCNVSVLIAGDVNSLSPYSIHIIRPVDTQKKMELAMRDFIVTSTGLSPDKANDLFSTTRSASREARLTARETEVLRLLAKGLRTAGIAGQLGVSRTTINNHIQHLLSKFSVHTRLEAIRRAQMAGLV